jgi:hypothetical protein
VACGAVKQDRIGAGVPSEVYETLCRAAELAGAMLVDAIDEQAAGCYRSFGFTASRDDPLLLFLPAPAQRPGLPTGHTIGLPTHTRSIR